MPTYRRFKSDDEDIDSSDMSFGNCGEEWPKSEHHDVARYRKFYQVKLLHMYSCLCNI